jgi:glutaredoxin
MNQLKIVAYLKPACGWSQGVRAILRKYELPFEDRDILNHPRQRQEMVQKSGQPLSPCVEIDGHMLADVSGDEVEAYLLAQNLVQPSDRVPEVPTNRSCSLHREQFEGSKVNS